MVPVIELRGGLPIGLSGQFGPSLNYWLALGVCIVGNLVPVPFIIIFIKKIFAWMRKTSKKWDGLVTKLEKRAESKGETVKKYAEFY